MKEDKLNKLLVKHQEKLRIRNSLYQQLGKVQSEINNCNYAIQLLENEILELEESEDEWKQRNNLRIKSKNLNGL